MRTPTRKPCDRDPDLSNETRRDVPGYEGCYQVSDMGRVRSVPRVIVDLGGAGEEGRAMNTPCKAQPELWFSADPEDQYEAAQACSFCPFVIACEKFGDDEIHGVWGGRLKGYTKTRRQPTTRTCGNSSCGNEFVTVTATAKYCSKVCSNVAAAAAKRAAYAAMSVCAFEPCGKRFKPKMKSQRFCCPECGQKNKRATARRAAQQLRENEHLRELMDAVS